MQLAISPIYPSSQKRRVSISSLAVTERHSLLQSAYKPLLQMSMNQQHVTLLVLLDLSAAFDTIHHDKLIQRPESDCGVTGNALAWFSSFPASVCQWWTFQEVPPVSRRPSRILLRPVAFHHIVQAIWHRGASPVKSPLLCWWYMELDKTEFLILGTK